MSISDVLALLGLLAVGAGMLGTTIWRLNSRMDRKVGEVHQRIDRIPDEYARRVDLEAHMGRLETRFENLATGIAQGFARIDTRIDAFLNANRGSER